MHGPDAHNWWTIISKGLFFVSLTLSLAEVAAESEPSTGRHSETRAHSSSSSCREEAREANHLYAG
jgi:hypothetical protein